MATQMEATMLTPTAARIEDEVLSQRRPGVAGAASGVPLLVPSAGREQRRRPVRPCAKCQQRMDEPSRERSQAQLGPGASEREQESAVHHAFEMAGQPCARIGRQRNDETGEEHFDDDRGQKLRSARPRRFSIRSQPVISLGRS